MDSLNVLNIDIKAQEGSEGIDLNVNIATAFQDFLGEELTKEFSKDASLQYIAYAMGLLLEKYINKKCISEEKKPE